MHSRAQLAGKHQFKAYCNLLAFHVSYPIFRLIVVGTKSSNGYVAKFGLSSLPLMSDFSSTTSISMSVYVDTTTSPSITIASLSDTVTNYTSSVIVQNVTYSSSIQYIPDYYIQENGQTYSLIESTTTTKTPDLTCSFSGSTSITYSIANYMTQVPSWVSLNPTSGQLSIATPNVTADTTYSFYINSAVSGISSPVQKLISITVLNWAVEFCSICYPSASICSVWNSGYNLTSPNTCSSTASNTSIVAKSEAVVNIVLFGAIVLLAGALRINNSNILCSLWSMVCQIQILFLLFLTRAYIPDDVKEVIIGWKFALNPFSFITFKNVPVISPFIENFDFELSNSNLEYFGIDSNSSVYNTISIFFALALIILFHIFVKVLKRLLALWGPWNSKLGCPIRAGRWIVEKLIIIMTYGYYIRFFLQLLQILLVISIFEISIHKMPSVYNIMSFIFAVLLLFGCWLFAWIVIYLSLSSYKISEEGPNKIGEIFNGIKMDKKYKIYASFMIIRKIVFISFLISLTSISSVSLIVILSWIQFWYLL